MARSVFKVGFGDNTIGNAVQWFPDAASRKVVGWVPNRPEKGDILRVKMQSGKVLLCKFIEVKHKRDPADMFFGYVTDIGYEGEKPFPRAPKVWCAVKTWVKTRRFVSWFIERK